MNRKPRIMILTAGYGEGHVQASKALKQQFAAHGIGDVSIVDLMKEAHPLLNTISMKLYIKSAQTSKYGLDYYGWSYYMTRDTKPEGSLSKYFNLLGKKKLKQLIDGMRPDALINTFPFGSAPEIGQETGIPTFTVVTDYALHARWIHPDNDKYYVATEELKDELLAKGFAAGQVLVSGIPIRQAFAHASAGAGKSLQHFNPGKPTVLILAGSYGVLSHIEHMVHTLRKHEGSRLVVVCGRNRKLETRLSEQFAGAGDIHIFGFVEQIHELMAASSCVVTKAGGLTLTEALTMRLPIFIYKPLAGQEKENAIYFERKGMAQISSTTGELEQQIGQFLANPSLPQRMKASMASVHKGNAADTIVQDVLRTVASTLPATV
ncbi:hypothetical protein SD70_16270 [Gordoniibacillus kamchatkensis]|uniref:Uncharacterized protein n=1 Tax=Gordoniibacillus kamchatkensis TaxID=1590651 RepID=A0ABR5AGQ2_9BACL|nr:glycosyltransferase [Paenibacillus sp. VKM B-2647]KIL40072.1 hypothetical protein SD70_16270 [Paenibacillus sp. VKM B-2647]